jgi:pimeloyl-ACP methyl ester carboxylesterase
MAAATKRHPLIFIHGLWIHSDAWQPWLEMFESHGYSVSAPGWPGDGPTVAATRENPEALNNVGIAEMVDHYAELIGSPEVKPIAIGHSFGGLIAQELLAKNAVAAAVAIDPAPIKGVKALPYAQLKSAFPVLSNPANLHRNVSLTAKQFHYSFGNTVTEEVFAMYSKGRSDTEFHTFEGKGHSLTIDNGWKDVADVTLNWLAAKGF